DEMYQNAGEKGIPHDDPEDPPRRRANRRRGHGTFATDRPPVARVVGRESGKARLDVVDRADGATLVMVVEDTTWVGATVDTDEWKGYNDLSGRHRNHVPISYAGPRSEWARDVDGDGVREAHVNTMEGHRTGLRNFLRPFRGVSKWNLDQYVAIFQWGHNLKRVPDDFLRVLLGVRPGTIPAS
ncbi:MAG TPA: transposase, partial [Isosphaeraceae bacterium]|nr:transposase [Isosphaeraceae bacterium]